MLPTAWQAVEYADVPEGGTLLVLGLGPIGDMAAADRHAPRRTRVIGVDLVPERLARGATRGAEAIDLDTRRADGSATIVRELHRRPRRRRGDRRGRHGGARLAAAAKAVQKLAGLLPDTVAEPLMMKAGVDRLAALHTAIDAVRRGGTVSIVGVYGGAADPLPMFQMFDKQVQVRMGQANVRAWTDDILALLTTTTTRSASRPSPPTTSRSTRPRRLRDVPEEGGRRRQGRLPTLIGYYVHHVGHGHLHRASAVAQALGEPVTGFSSLPAPAGWPGPWIELERDDGNGEDVERTARDRLHWVPIGHRGLRSRMAEIASWIGTSHPPSSSSTCPSRWPCWSDCTASQS